MIIARSRMRPRLWRSDLMPTVLRSLRGRLMESGLTLARSGWFALALATLALLSAGVPQYLAHVRTVCVDGPCSFGQLGPDGLRALQEHGIPMDLYVTLSVAMLAGSAVVWAAAACFVFWRRPGDRMALLTATFLMSYASASANILRDAAAASNPVWWLIATVVHSIGAVALAVFVVVFPDGRWSPDWSLWLTFGWTAFLLPDAIVPGSPIDSATWPPAILLAVLLILAGGTIYAQVWRYRRVSGAVQRQQTKWAVYGLTGALTGWAAVVFALYLVIPQHEQTGSPLAVLVGGTFRIIQLLIPLSIGLAVSRSRLWDIDPIVRRSLIYAGLTGAVVVLYALVVEYFAVFFGARDNPLPPLVATAVVAVLFQPLREHLQSGVNRLLYGRRDEPLVVLARLGQRLEGTLAPDAVLTTIVQTMAEALKLPYVAIALEQGDTCEIAMAHGAPSAAVERWLLSYHHEKLGELLLAPRAPGETFSRSDRQLLDDLVRQASVAVYAVRMTRDLQHLASDLQQSRERLITAREEERRRLRRDLHDSVGPSLAGLVQRLDTASRLVPRDADAAVSLLGQVKLQVRGAIGEIRQLAYALRPPALDELGLVSAISEYAAQHLEPAGVLLSIDAPSPNPALSAAVEVAAYRIVLEALTNVARHARAHTCQVRFEFGSDLVIEVIDDGVGLSNGARAGIGLASMRERAEELGGACVVGPGPAGGTRVRARLPCPQLSPGST